MKNNFGLRVLINYESMKVYNTLYKLGFEFNNGGKEDEKLESKLGAHTGYIFKFDKSCYIGSDLDYERDPKYYEKYAKFTITEDELLRYVRFKNAKYKDSDNRIRLIEDLWKTYQKREEAEAVRTLIKAL